MMKGFNRFFLLALLFSALAACGGGGNDGYGSGSGGGGGTGDTPSGEGTTPPVDIEVGSIIISYPVSNAIVDNKDGTYSRKFSVLVRDKDGTPAPNGVRVDLQVVDTILAMGVITDVNLDTISDTNLSIPSVVQTDATPGNLADNPLADLTTAYVTRPGLSGGSYRQIEANDLVIMTGSKETVDMSGGTELGQVNSHDVVRTIANAPTLANELTVNDTYNSSYPAYGGSHYYIAGSMLSAGVTGEDADGVPTQGYTVTKGGLGTAVIWVTYASNIEHIHAGCAPAELDDRVDPMGSSQPMLVATTGAVSDEYPFCFSAIAGYKLSAIPNNLTNGGNVTVCTIDGGDGVAIPYTPVVAVQTDGTAVATITSAPSTPTIGPTEYTDGAGCYYMNITATGASGDSAIVTTYAGDGSVDITVKIP